MIDMLERGAFPVADAISTIVPMEDAPATLAEWSQAPAKFTKILVQVS